MSQFRAVNASLNSKSIPGSMKGESPQKKNDAFRKSSFDTRTSFKSFRNKNFGRNREQCQWF